VPADYITSAGWRKTAEGGLPIADCGFPAPIPNPHSPVPNPESRIPFFPNLRYYPRVKALVTLTLSVVLSFAAAAAAQTAGEPRDDGDARSLLLALDRQERYLEGIGAASLKLGARQIPKARVIATVRELRRLVLAMHGKPEFGRELARRFEIVTVARDALFTAYHTPLLRVSDRRTATFQTPILGRPRDLVEKNGRVRRSGGQPAPTRAQIMDGAYDADALAVAWTDDPVEFYYAQIQGGALVSYPDGRRRTLLFDGNNGYEYVSVEPDILRQVPESARPGGYLGLREYLRRHPQDAAGYFRANPRYIFFRVADEPPSGMARLPLTTKRSIATDKHYYSAGLIALIEFTEPSRRADGQTETRRVQYLAADADTGAAIKGPGRVDIYFGEGAAADLFPTGIKQQGVLSYLLLRQRARDPAPDRSPAP